MASRPVSARASPLERGDAFPSAVGGFRLHVLDGSQSARHAAARDFCLATIKEFYGFDYRADWHEDLDTLLLPEDRNHYSRPNRGGFWYLTDADGRIVATVGVRALAWKPAIAAAFRDRYPEPGRIGSLWRLYVSRKLRGKGIGRRLNALAEEQAAQLGYHTMYLHATTDATATIGFWKAMGYADLGDHESSTHFDKPLTPAKATA